MSLNPPTSNFKPKSGYTKEDWAVRCQHCCIGVDETGHSIGSPIAAYRISCQVEPKKSVAVARLGRCINMACEQIYKLDLLPAARTYNISESSLRHCLANSRGNWFTLAELQGEYTEAPIKPVIVKRDYNEPDDVEVF